jgi:hypothetical protein
MPYNQRIFVIEQGKMIVIREAEGTSKDGKNKMQTITKFKEPIKAAEYLKQKYGIVSRYLSEKYGIDL